MADIRDARTATVLEPPGPVGTANAADTAPLLEVVKLATVEPRKVTVPATRPWKPEPETATEDPIGPDPGESEMAAVFALAGWSWTSPPWAMRTAHPTPANSRAAFVLCMEAISAIRRRGWMSHLSYSASGSGPR